MQGRVSINLYFSFFFGVELNQDVLHGNLKLVFNCPVADYACPSDFARDYETSLIECPCQAGCPNGTNRVHVQIMTVH